MYLSITELIIAIFSIFRDHCETERQDKQLSLRGQQRPRMRLNFVQTMCTSSYLSFIFLGLFRHLSGINDTAITHRCTFAKSLNLHINIAADDGIVLQGPDHLPSLSKNIFERYYRRFKTKQAHPSWQKQVDKRCQKICEFVRVKIGCIIEADIFNLSESTISYYLFTCNVRSAMCRSFVKVVITHLQFSLFSLHTS